MLEFYNSFLVVHGYTPERLVLEVVGTRVVDVPKEGVV